MAPDRTILHLVKNNYGVNTMKPHLLPLEILLKVVLTTITLPPEVLDLVLFEHLHSLFV
jgi:hypothetical protein